MYRIEFEPGDVGVFRSVEEVATAIKSGVITTRARIYHQATDKWLPIEFHPHYRKALEMVASGNIPTSTSSASSRSNSAPATRPVAHTAVEVVPPPAPVAVEVPKPEPVTIQHVELEPPAPPQFESQPSAEIASAEPAVEVTSVEVESVEAETESARQPSQPDVPIETEPAPPPPDFVFKPRSREIRFIPLEEPKPLGLGRRMPSEQPLPMPPIAEPAPAASASDGAHAEAPSLDVLFGVHPRDESPAAETAPTDGVGNDGMAQEPDASSRPLFRSRFRLAGVRNLRRPVLVAAAGLALVVSTHFGLSAVKTLNAGVMTSGWASLPFLSRESAGTRDGSGPLNEAQSGGRLPTALEPHGSPSFGASSAFPAASRAGSPSDAKHPGAGSNPASTPVEKPVQATDSVVRAAPVAQIAIAAPKIPGLPGATNVKLTPAVLVTHYEAAYAAARAELETGFKTAGFANIFAIEHLSSAQGVRAARLSAGTASAYVLKYRRREAEIEAVYADSAAALVKTPADHRAWEGRKVLQESPEVAKLAGFLLSEIDSVFGVLASQDGSYEVKDGAITFQDAGAAKAYSELRPWVDRQAHQWADSGESTAARVLRAIGSTRLPEGAAF